MADNTIAKAYVQIIPTTRGIKGSLESELGGSTNSAGIAAGNTFGAALKKTVAGLAIGKTITDTIKKSVEEGAALQQSMGGIETMFKDNADKVMKYASDAYKTAGMSANEYMETVTGFSASLLQSLGGDTGKAADIANMALTDMSDNANKFGTDMGAIQNAYQGFAKQNYTMLDNLKLGYGGTKTEMERLLADASKLSGQKYDIGNLSDVYDAIHVVQNELGVTGTTAKEAAYTLSGSFSQLKASFTNVLGGLALGEDIKPSLNALGSTFTTFFSGNLIPTISNVFAALPSALVTTVNELAPTLIPAGMELLGSLYDGVTAAIPSLIDTVGELIPTIVTQLAEGLPKLFEQATTMFMKIVEAIPVVVPKLLKALPQIVNGIINAVVKMGPQLFKTAGTALFNIVKAIPGIIGSALSAISNVGLNLVKGLWNGISNAAGWVLDKIRGFGQTILNGIKNIFGIHSPSTETAWMGNMLMQGLANGIDDNAKKAVNSMRNAANSALGAVDAGAFSFGGGNYTFSGSGAGSNISVPVNITVYGAQGQDVNQLADVVMSRISDVVERKVAAFA